MVFSFSGCSGVAEMPVSGQVTYGDEPILKGTIVFRPTEPGLPQAVASIQEGRYQTVDTEGVASGDYLVQITGYRSTGETFDRGALHGNRTGEVMEQFVPATYNSASTLSVTIKKGQAVYDFQLPLVDTEP